MTKPKKKPSNCSACGHPKSMHPNGAKCAQRGCPLRPEMKGK